MTQQRIELMLWVVTLATVNLLSVVFVKVNHPAPADVGYVLGSLFAQVTLAAAWGAFGLESFRLRFPLSIIWAALAAVALPINFRLHQQVDDISTAVGIYLLVQWLVL